MTINSHQLSKTSVLTLSIGFAILTAISVLFDFLPVFPFVAGFFLLIFFTYPVLPTFLLTFLFLISQEVLVIPKFGLALQLPTEPLVVILGITWVIYSLFGKKYHQQQFTFFDVSVLIYLSMLIVSVALSSHVVISLKFLLNALGYLIVCVYWTRESINTDSRLFLLIRFLFLFSIFVAVFSITKHSFAGFAKDYSNTMTEPFFEEHGTYAAYMSIIFGFSFVIALSPTRDQVLKILSIVTASITFIAVILSYTRAAWLSCLFIIVCFFIFRARIIIKNKLFWIFPILIIGIVTFLGSSILENLQQNALTIVDVQRNVSNLERINRWVAAINMFLEKPIFGFGVGTYPIHYYDYANPLFKTIISDMFAGAHNDYLQYLSEAGVVGLTSWLMLLFSIYFTAFKTIRKTEKSMYVTIVFGALLGISTYLFHALFNGYLEFDKVAVPFWLCVGIIMTVKNLHSSHHQELSST